MITFEMLQKNRACYWIGRGRELADRIEASLPATLHEIVCWDWMPFGDRELVFVHFADQRRVDAYNKDKAPLLEACNKAKATHWDAYEKDKAEALKEATK